MKPIYGNSAKKAAAVAERWREQYFHAGRWGTAFGRSAEIKYEELKALGASPTPEEVAGVIGNTAWVDEFCSACHEYAHEWITVGEESDYESATATLCPNCFEDAIRVFRSKGENNV